MKITDLKAIVFKGAAIVRIDTDEGLSGLGEAHCPKQHVLGLKPAIMGQDPTNVERVLLRIRHRGGYKPWGAGVSGVEMALWDLAGKAAGLPVYKLLGGKVRDRVRVYLDCGAGVREEGRRPKLSEFYSPESYAENAQRKRKLPEGFTLFKFDIGFHGPQLVSVPGGVYEAEGTYPDRGHATEKGLKSELAIVKALKEALGDEVGLALDCGPGQSIPAAISLARALEPYNLAWAEDLLTGDYVPYTDPEAYRLVSQSTSTPILTGEHIYLRQGFRELIGWHAVDIVAPDACDVGGLAETKWIAELADLYGVLIAPHNAGLPISYMANVHAAAAMPRNYIAFEFHSIDDPEWLDMVRGVEKPLIKDGFTTVPDTPGLGLELNEPYVRKHLAEGETYFE
ncbi:MAG: mandelate racemase/muconate lactonizing enzyme family protein [Candidatus Bathyarchaeia archaeon]